MTTRTKDSVPEPPASLEEEDLTAMSLAHNNYDFSWRQLPYGIGWDAYRIKELSDRLVSVVYTH